MRRVTRLWKLGLLLAAAVAGLAIATLVLTEPKMAVAIVDQGGGDNAAIAFNTRDDSTSFASRFRIVRSKNETVDQQNAAIAYANCDSCRTVANATQVVLVMDDGPEVIAPTNVAVAVNENCTDCETLANAYQAVIGAGGPVRFTPEGNRRIAEIRKKYQQLRNSGLSIEEIQAELDAYEAELNDVLADELVPAGNSGNAPSNSESEATPEPSEPTTSSEPAATGETTIGGAQPSPDVQGGSATGGAARQEGPAPGGSEQVTESSKSITKTEEPPTSGTAQDGALPDGPAPDAPLPQPTETTTP